MNNPISKLFCGLLVIAASTTAIAEPLSIGTNPQGSVTYATGAALANLFTNNGRETRVVPQGGPPVTVPMVNNGRLEFSMANSFVMRSAQDGTFIFDGRPQDNVKVAANLFPLYTGLIVPADSDINTISDLAGNRIGSRFTQQVNVGVIAEAILAAGGLTYDDVSGVPVPNGNRGVQDLMEGRADAAVFSLTSGVVRQADASLGGIRIIDMNTGENPKQTVESSAPGATVGRPAEGTKITGLASGGEVVIQGMILTASSSTPDDVVYDVVKMIHESQETLAEAVSNFKNFNPEDMAETYGAELHPGARRYYEEAGLI